MTAPHFFADDVSGDLVRIEGPDARHALRSLRLRDGEAITIADGRGTVVDARIRVEPGGRAAAVTAEVVQRRIVRDEPPALIAYPALAKAGKLELIVQKLTELGVASIRPWSAARSVVRWDERKGAAAVQRLEAIAREAAMQCRRATIPDVRPPAPLEDLPSPTFVLHEGTAPGLLGGLPEQPPVSIGLVTGPEGGLSEPEIDALERAGALLVGLGASILRTETAAIASAVLVLGRYGKLG